MPRTSKCVLENVLEAKGILEDSTFDDNNCKLGQVKKLFQNYLIETVVRKVFSFFLSLTIHFVLHI